MPRQGLYLPGTPITFMDSTGTVQLTLNNLAALSGRISARYDRGATARPALHLVRGIFQFRTVPIIAEAVDIYVAQSDGTAADGVVGTADAVLTSGQASNLGNPVCKVRAQTATASVDFIASGLAWVSSRYLSIGVFNRAVGDNLRNSANTSRVIVTPYSLEWQ